MIITLIGSDYVEINQNNMYDKELTRIKKIHLIKLKFKEPDRFLLNEVINLYPKTNRYIIDDNIKQYNFLLKKTSKKYYVENLFNCDIITYLRKNNKILFNFENLNDKENQFFLKDKIFNCLLKNVEVIKINKIDFNEKRNILKFWKGNVIIV